MKKLSPKTKKLLKLAGGAYLLSRLFSTKTTTAQRPAISYPVNYPTAILEQNAIALPTNKKDLGLIMWEGFHTDYWNNPNPPYKKTINQATAARIKLSRLKEAGINLVPFYGIHTAPTEVELYTNPRWNEATQTDEYDTEKHIVTVDFNYNQAAADAQIQYALQGGISFLAFDHYAMDSPMSLGYQYFVNSQNKGSMKFCFYWPNLGWPWDKQFNLNYIGQQMTKSYYYRHNGRPVLFVNQNNFADIQNFRNAYSSAGGQGEIYFVYSDFNDIPKDGNYAAYGFSAGSNYLTPGRGYGGNHLFSGIIQQENEVRADFLATTTNIDLVATVTSGVANYQKINPFDRPGYTNPGTDQEIESQLNNAFIFAANNPRVPFLNKYAGSENVECAKPFMPIRLPNGSIDNSQVLLHRKVILGL